MFLPLYDGIPVRNIKVAWVTYAILGVTLLLYAVLAFEMMGMASEEEKAAWQAWVAAAFGTIPAVLFGTAILPDGLPMAPEVVTLLTGQFIHFGILHVLGNMAFLWVFGDNVEDALGHWRFALFYVLCGVVGGFVYALGTPDSLRPLVGASGAVSGLIAAYLLLHPRARVWGLFFNRIPLHVPAVWAIGFWLVFQVVQIWFGGDDVGWLAHVGGFFTGALLVVVMHRRRQPLFATKEQA